MDKVLQILNPYLDDLWLERRDNMDALIQLVADNSKVDCYLVDFSQFLTFLKLECSGTNFNNDKQWSELLNLMQISKLINHKTLRLNHLLKNKQQIELNRSRIRQFNEQARRITAINNLLIDLEKAIASCQLDLSVIIDKKSQVDFDNLDLTGLIDKISTSQRYIQDFCRVPLNVLQAELRGAANPTIPHDNSTQLFDQDNLAQYKQKLMKFRLNVELFECFLENLLKFESMIRQLNPLLINQEPKKPQTTKSSIQEKSISGNSINRSLNQCKSTYGQILEFNKQLLATLLTLKSTKSTSLSKGSIKRDTAISMIRLIANATGKQSMQFSIVKPELFSVGLRENLNKSLECKSQLEKIFNLLRLEFGRLYFVNDVELLRIISLDTQLVSDQTKETRELLSKLYNNSISSFILMAEDDGKIIGVGNPYGERILFHDHKEDPVLLHKKVNIYSLEIIRILNSCMQKLRKTLRNLLLENCRTRSDVINFELPVQLMVLSEHLEFSKLVESTNLKIDHLSKIGNFYESRLSQLNAMLDSEQANELSYYKHSACISQTIQFLSILSELNMAKEDELDWIWMKQLRYGINFEQETCDCFILDMKFEYNFDYLPFQVQLTTSATKGQPSAKEIAYKRLIATKMTNRCLLVAAHSLSYLRLGANPFGPAGSGKTETIKSLGHALGHIVIVHNCDESNDGKALDRLIWGLAHTGLWGCFDEFNRLSESTLSSVSSTLELVQTSLRHNLKTVRIDASKQIMSLDSNAAFFITLNPIDKGARYGGRRRLPANLRSLFQPISMIQIPMLTIVSESLRILIASSSKDNHQISSEQFMEVSGKLVKLFKEMARFGSNLTNCEWDLRLVVAILNRFQIISRQFKDTKKLPMNIQLASAIHYELLPRFKSDKSLTITFETSLSDIFGISQEFKLELMQDLNFGDKIYDKRQEQLCRHLHSQLESRNGVILLGSSKSGKSETWRQLISALNNEAKVQKVDFLEINPRSCKRDELFGSEKRNNANEDTNSKWLDGLFTHVTRFALRKLRTINEMSQFWIILDGPLEPDWVETLNSVLDDNQVLTLGSGERLDFNLPHANKSIKLIFETDDISLASPATISRLGLVYHESVKESSSDVMRQIDSTNFSKVILEQNLNRLLVLIGPEQQASKLMSNQKHTKYICHAHSIAHDLISLVDCSTSQAGELIYLANFDTIEPEDKWQVKSFEQLLSFIVSYGKFYNPLKGPWNSQINEFKFVLHCESVDNFNARLANKCDFYKIIAEHTDYKVNHHLLQPNQLIAAIKQSNNDTSIISVLCNGHSEQTLIDDICKNLAENVRTFDNGRQIRLNLEHMMQRLSTTETAKLDECSQVYVMTELQFNLMQKDQSDQLLFQLNQLNSRRGGNVVFAYLTTKLDRFWESIGSTLSLINYEDSFRIDRKSIKSDLRLKLASKKAHLNEEKLDWLATKLSDTQIDLFRKEFKCELVMEQFYNLLGNLLDQFESNLMMQKVSLESGLQRLTTFENNIESVRDICKSRVADLTCKRLEMDSVVKSLDEKLISSELLKSQLGEMSSKQESKSVEIGERQAKIEEQLERVKPLLENSKKDIEQHLKPESLNEIRTLRSPPKTIKDILDGVFLLLGKTRDLSWTEAKCLLARASLRTEITSLNLKKIMTQQMVLKLTQLMQDPNKKDSFERVRAERASKAILPLLNWLLAVYEFGKVQANMLPLSKELSQLEVEQAEIGASIEKSRLDISSLEKTIEIDREKLQLLRRDYGSMELESKKLNNKIEHALKALQDCSSQLTQWRLNLSRLKQMESRNDPMRYALYGSIIATSESVDSSNLLNLLEFEHDKSNCLIKLEHFLSNKVTICGKSSKISEEKLSELLKLRMLVEESSLIPFVDIKPADSSMQEDQFDQVQAIQQLIGQYYSNRSKSQFQHITCHELSDWSSSLEIAMRLNKFIILHLVESNNNITLDILNVIISQKKKVDQKLELILVGNSDKQRAIVSLGPVKCIKLASNGDHSAADLKEKLMFKLMQHFDSNLSDSVEKLELELKRKRQERANLETNLIMKLSSQQETKQTGDQIALDEPLIVMLSELQLKSKQFDLDLEELENKLSLLNGKRDEIYEKIAGNASKFYMENIMPICKLNPSFYKISPDRFLKLSIGNYENNSIENGLNYTLALKALYTSLAPDDKIKARQIWGLMEELSSDLESLIEGLLEQSGPINRLMIAVHDANKPSPQAYLDYLLTSRRESEAANKLLYFKLFATSALEENQQMAVRLSEILRQTGDEQKSGLITIVICIVNAHLASKWINSKLLDELKCAFLERKMRLLCIVVAEVESNSIFEYRLLDKASCLYWHDELSLSLVQRFELYEKSLKIESDSELIRRLILFHVICQERSKLSHWQESAGYCFEYEQLARAWQTRLKQEAELRLVDEQYFANYLSSLLYGSQMNRAEDETTLTKLANRFLCSKDDSPLDLLNKYKESGQLNSSLYDQLMAI